MRVIALVSVVVLAAISTAHAQEVQVRELASAHFSLHYLTDSVLQDVQPAGQAAPSQLSVVELPSRLREVRLFRVRDMGAPHGVPILVGWSAGVAWGLAGTHAPGMPQLASALEMVAHDSTAARWVAAELARLLVPLDPEPGVVEQPAVRCSVSVEGVYRRSTGGYGVSVSVAPASGEAGSACSPARFGFEFSRDGGLLAWSRASQ